jgi:signal transduction histidine kinase
MIRPAVEARRRVQHKKLRRRRLLIDAHRWGDDAGVHAASLSRSPRAVAISAGGVVAMGVLVALAVRADSQAPSASPWLTAMDIAVGLAFVAAGLAAGGPIPERVLVAAVGPAWLAGSFLVGARSLHQAVLVVALVAFPAGRVRGIVSWLLVGLAGLVALGLLPQLGVAVLFAGIAAAVLARWRTDPAAVWYPAGAAAAVAAVLAWVWWIAHRRIGTFDATVILLSYELVLLLVAGCFPLGAAAVLRERARLADPLLSEGQLAGLDGLAVVLGDVLGDPDLRVYRWRDADAALVDGRGQRVAGRGDRQWLAVDGPNGPVAVVAHRSSALDDGPTAAAVAAAVRLAVTHLRLQEEQQERLGELEASRARLVAAADRQRARAAAELRQDVEAPLRVAQSELVAMRAAVHDPEAAAAIDVVVQELATATGELADLVAGIPPADLGGGRLGRALHALAEASPVPVTVAVAEDTAASQEAETALFYVCCEALANAVKHAGATRVVITVERQDGRVVATVADDGRGGAEPSGSGLVGLADRLAARNGRLRVESPLGAGTRVTATVPG